MQRVHRVIKHIEDYEKFIQELIDRIPADTTDDNIIKEHYIKKFYNMQFPVDLTKQELRRYGCRRER